jgi:hypothetical protein
LLIFVPLWKTVWRPLKKVKIELPCDPSITFLRMYPKECESSYNKGTCTPMFIAALFTITKYGNSQDASQLMNGLRKCGIHVQNLFY